MLRKPLQIHHPSSIASHRLGFHIPGLAVSAQ
jgi:hypothetical protein